GNDKFPNNWKCYTHACEKQWGKSLVSLTRALLNQNGNKYNTTHTVEFLLKFLNKDISQLGIEITDKEKQDFIRRSRILNGSNTENVTLLRREDVKKELIIPPKQYLDKGYSKEVLKKHLIGYCPKKGREMSYRIVAPIFDEKNKFCIACTGRTIFPQCTKCKKYHFGTDCQ